MKPLLVVTSFNRQAETLATLASLVRTGATDEAKVVVFDNCSVDGTAEELWRLVSTGRIRAELILSQHNIGCPRALNFVLGKYRDPGQAMIKSDNDVEFLTDGWVSRLDEFVRSNPEIAMLGPWYDEIAEGDGRHRVDHGNWIEMFPLIGHCVYHAGDFMDQVGFFDVLAADHLYGFEDLLMSHRAAARGYACGAFKGVEMKNIQRKNSLDTGVGLEVLQEGRDDHVARLRPLYDMRVTLAWQLKAGYWVDARGQVVNR